MDGRVQRPLAIDKLVALQQRHAALQDFDSTVRSSLIAVFYPRFLSGHQHDVNANIEEWQPADFTPRNGMTKSCGALALWAALSHPRFMFLQADHCPDPGTQSEFTPYEPEKDKRG